MDNFIEREILEQLKQLNIVTRVNNVLLSRFILQLQTVKKELGLPRTEPFCRFELLKEDYDELVQQFGKHDTDRALYLLDRAMARNKVQCPHNIKKYIRTWMRRNAKQKEYNREHYGKQKEDK